MPFKFFFVFLVVSNQFALTDIIELMLIVMKLKITS